jgi:hypothetical protein
MRRAYHADSALAAEAELNAVRARGAPSEREFGDGRCDPASFVCGLQTAEVDDAAPMDDAGRAEL